MKKMSLGKGLSALIPDSVKQEEAERQEKQDKHEKQGVLEVLLSNIKPGKYQPRKYFDQCRLQELVESIKSKGIVQPLLVRKISEDKYELIAGERRLRAAKEAGLEKAPVIVKNVADLEFLELALIENIQRDDLNPIEEAQAYKQLIDDFSLTHDDISKRVGRDRATVTNVLRLLKLPEDIQKDIASGNLTLGHAKAIVSLEKTIDQKFLTQRIIQQCLSVRETEKLVSEMKGRKFRVVAKKENLLADVGLRAAEDELKRLFATKVIIAHKSNSKGGRIEIEYYSFEDLERILDLLRS